MVEHPEMPVVLTIATSDSGAGAGVQADLKAIAARGAFGVCAFAGLTAQNPGEVRAIKALSPKFLRQQLETLADYFEIKAVKTGMLVNAELIAESVRFLKRMDVPIIVDPVMVSSSGAVLLEPEALETLQDALFPLADVLTPNLDEAGSLIGAEIGGLEDMRGVCRRLVTQYDTSVLLKGGHLEGDQCIDLLLLPDGTQKTFTANRQQGVNTHGSGCTLASAIAAEQAHGRDIVSAVDRAHRYLQAAFATPLLIGKERFLNPFANPAPA